ncbi:FAD-binding oxidoreductase [Bacillus sp. FJAT-42376]|uniref:FAD-binding oxidoreductase n=1 Tax=Bacillus sp. FJAT-42376 TaxID=2014076 RepID=UPI000F4E28B4|nr:FAD-binding oxidoreductase [Bacillus sp. FJAT-42376]AZB42441.1 FAD-binding oxidoreductase [Bacillus sp. FJAT-42376]
MKKRKTIWKKPYALAILVLLLAGFIVWNIPVEKRKYGLSQSGLATDYTGLLPEKIERAVQSENRDQLQKIVKEANEKGEHISIAGLQHSQGGHTYYKNGTVLDMKGMNRILELNEKERTVKVEAGASWDDVQKAVNPYGLALKVTQSQSIFTVGGSLSVNAHGRDIRNGPMAGTVKEITLLTPSGDIQKLTRGDERLKYVLGGYGLFGVILDATLELTENTVYRIHTEELPTEQYEDYFHRVLRDRKTGLHYARISVAPGSFLKEMYAFDYNISGPADHKTPLKGETAVRLSKLALDMGRSGGLMEDFFWTSQKQFIRGLNGKLITRNNAMRSESEFMEFTSPGRVEVLQEFFVPADSFEEYINALKRILPANDQRDDFKVHNITVRFAAEDSGTSLNYAKENMLGLVVLIQHGLTEQKMAHAQEMIQKWTDLTMDFGGTYYLPYYPYQTKNQFKRAYPEWEMFKNQKSLQDPKEIFVNLFYDHYLQNEGG